MNAVKTKKHIFPIEWIEDNENLIAAAPALLEALQALKGMIEDRGLPYSSVIMNKVNAAINKATNSPVLNT